LACTKNIPQETPGEQPSENSHLALLVPWGWWVSEFVVHAPGFWLLHIVWVWLIIATVAIAAVVSGGAHAYSLFRERFLASP